MIYYLDTSALVKAYVDEHRSEDVRALLRGAAAEGSAARIYVSRIAYPEATSAFTRLRTEGKLSASEAELRFRSLDSDFTATAPAYEVLDAGAQIVNESAELVRRHRLRGFDAVHLSSALLLHRITESACTLVAADRQLLAAATIEGIPLLDLR